MTVEGRDITEEALGEEVSAAGEYGISGTCETCQRPRSKHVIIDKRQLEEVWRQGILATICASVNCDEVAVWVTRSVEPGDLETIDPCDQEFMEAISS